MVKKVVVDGVEHRYDTVGNELTQNQAFIMDNTGCDTWGQCQRDFAGKPKDEVVADLRVIYDSIIDGIADRILAEFSTDEEIDQLIAAIPPQYDSARAYWDKLRKWARNGW